MATLPADEDYARALLSIFKAKHLSARQSLRMSEAQAMFLRQNMGRASDFEAALQYAMSRGWLAPALDMIRLTPPGAEEMQSVAGFL
jgi:hypothetical protein